MRRCCSWLAVGCLTWAGAAGAQAPATPPPAAAAAPVAYYFDRPVTPADLQGKTLRELSLMRNTIFARVGNPFRKPWLDAYFSAQPWYQKAARSDLGKLSELDWANARVIAQYETSVKPEELQARVTEIKARKAAGGATPDDDIELGLISTRLGKWVGDDKIDFEKRSPLEDPSQLDRQLTKDQLDHLSLRELRLLRNTIFARQGYAFKSAILRRYFEETGWYKVDPSYQPSKLSKLDWRNVKLIRSVEDAAGGPMTDGQHMQEEEWLFAA